MADDSRVRLSKTLSWLLRHGAVESGLPMGPDGYVPVSLVLSLSKLRGVTMPILEDIVATCPKQRFQLTTKPDGTRCIRATQGHTITALDDEQLLRKITDPMEFPVVVHGTYMKFWPSILYGGLKPGQRNHIHFASGEPGRGGVMSGARSNVNVLIYADVPKAMADGIEFHVSANGVILTRGNAAGCLPPAYFKRVVQINRGRPDSELPIITPPDAPEPAVAAAGAGRRGVWGGPRPSGPAAPSSSDFPPLSGGSGGASSPPVVVLAPGVSADGDLAVQRRSKHARPAKSGPSPPVTAPAPAIGGSCPFRYLLVLDFEATCDNPVQTSPQEIIEFPTVVIDVPSGRVVDEFRRHVTPVVHPVLTPFCTSLTGITQADVTGPEAVSFPTALEQYLSWLSEKGYTGVDGTGAPVRSAVVTCGDWDLKTMLPTQLSVSKIPGASSVLKQWINLKRAYAVAYGGRQPRGMEDMLSSLKLPLLGRHHCGIDDCRNIAAVALAMLAAGHGGALNITGSKP